MANGANTNAAGMVEKQGYSLWITHAFMILGVLIVVPVIVFGVVH